MTALESCARTSGDAEPSEGPSQRPKYFDARDIQARVSQDQSRSANRRPSLPNTLPSDNDYFNAFRSPSGGFRGPGGSLRHTGLKEYGTLPPTHPILSPNSTRRPAFRGGNDQECRDT